MTFSNINLDQAHSLLEGDFRLALNHTSKDRTENVMLTTHHILTEILVMFEQYFLLSHATKFLKLFNLLFSEFDFLMFIIMNKS